MWGKVTGIHSRTHDHTQLHIHVYTRTVVHVFTASTPARNILMYVQWQFQIFGYHAADSDIRLSCGGSKQSAIMRRIQTFGYLVADLDIRLEGGNLICFPVYLMFISSLEESMSIAKLDG